MGLPSWRIKYMTIDILRDLANSSDVLHCPYCPQEGYTTEYCYPASVYVNAGGNITSIASHGRTIMDAAPSGRGVRIDIHLGFECGHGAILSLQFHKGQTIVTLRRNDAFRPVIWRD